MITVAAMRSGFTSRLVVDYPNSAKAKKFYLVLYCGPQMSEEVPEPLGVDEAVEGIDFAKRAR